MIRVGWFGKVPSSKEYVSEEINGRLPLWLRSWVEDGHDLFVSRFPERRGKIFRNLRFIILDQQNEECLVGILSESTDSIGRMFPVTYFVEFPLSMFSELSYMPLLAGPMWRLLENTEPGAMDVVREQVEDWRLQGQLDILPANRKYLDELIDRLSVEEFLRLSGVHNSAAARGLFGLKEIQKNGNKLPPLCIKGILPGEKTLFFLCLWYFIIKKVFLSSYVPHCFVSSTEAGSAEFALFFRWPLKLDFLHLQGINTESDYTIDLTGRSAPSILARHSGTTFMEDLGLSLRDFLKKV